MHDDEILDRAADLVERAWTSGAFARNLDMEAVRPEAPDAVAFCLYGAVRRIDRTGHGLLEGALVGPIEAAAQAAYSCNASWVSDVRGATAAARVLRDAAELVRAGLALPAASG